MKHLKSYKELLLEKASSKAQQKAAGMAYAAKKGDLDPEDLVGAAKEMYDSMSLEQLEKLAKTKHEGLPDQVDEALKASEMTSFDELIKKYPKFSGLIRELKKSGHFKSDGAKVISEDEWYNIIDTPPYKTIVASSLGDKIYLHKHSSFKQPGATLSIERTRKNEYLYLIG